MATIEERILKDIEIFGRNIKGIDREKIGEGQRKIVELAEMYARDSKAFFDKGDFYTSFSSIAYAHGLLDSVRKLNGLIE